MKILLTTIGLLMTLVSFTQIRPDQQPINYNPTLSNEVYGISNGSIERYLFSSLDSLFTTGALNEITYLSDTSGISSPQNGDIAINNTKDTLVFRGTYGWLVFVGGGGGGSMNSWTLRADSGSAATISDAENVTISGGGIASTSISGNTVTVTATEVDGSTSNEIQTIDTLDYSGGTITIALENDDEAPYTVNISGVNTDDQNITLDSTASSYTLSVEDGNSVSFSKASGSDSIFKQENSSTAATSGTTNNYHTGDLGIGDFSSNTLGAGLHMYGTTNATIRLSDSCSTDTCALAYLDFFRGYNTTNLGRFGFSQATDPDLYITNFLSGGYLNFQTNGTNKFRIYPSGQLQALEYGDTTFTGTPVKWWAEDDDGNIIESDITPPVSSPSVSSITNINFNNLPFGTFDIDLTSGTATQLNLSNPRNGGEYKFWFENSSNDTIVFPDNFLSKDRDSLKSRIATTNEIMDFFYDGTNYITTDTIWVASDPPNIITDYIQFYEPWAYYRADSITGLSDLDTVATWSDISGNSRDLSQDSTNYKPIYNTADAGTNLLPTVNFGTDAKVLYSSSTHTWTADTIVVVAVVTNSSTGANQTIASMFETATSERVWIFGENITSDYIRLHASENGTNIQTNNWTGPISSSYQIVVVKVATTHEDARINAADKTNVDHNISGKSISDEDTYLSVGGFQSPTVPTANWTGKISLLAIFDKDLTTGQIQNIENFVNSLYGLY